MSRTPIVSVILPVYNGESFIAKAIESILAQSFIYFELIIINDCSPDNSLAVINQYKDERIRLVSNTENLGLVGALNKGIELSTGKYIARMDQDDFSTSQRLEKQVEFLDQNTEYSLVGTNYRAFGIRSFSSISPISHIDVSLELHIHNCICHPSVMLRKADLIRKNLSYNPAFRDCEDYGLWIDMLKNNLKLGNLEEELIHYRIDGQSTTNHQMETRKNRLTPVYHYLLATLFNYADQESVEAHCALSVGKIENTSVKTLKKHKNRIFQSLLTKGFSEEKIKALLKEKSIKLSYSVIKRNWLEGCIFLISHGVYNRKTSIYLLSRLKNLFLSRLNLKKINY